MAPITRHTMATSLLLPLVIAAAAGCNKADATAMNPNASPPPRITGSIWEPDPGWANQLVNTLTFDKYQVSAFRGLNAVPEATKAAGAMNVFTWRVESGTDKPTIVLMAAITEDKTLVEEAKKNMKQALINFTAGMTKPMGFSVIRKSEVETGSLDGIPFSRFMWESNFQASRMDVSGYSYGGIDGDRAILALVVCYGRNGDGNLGRMQAVMATFKKKP